MKELCVRCGKETKYDTSTPITLRRYFIEGAGQLCEECWKEVFNRKNDNQSVRKRNGNEYPTRTVSDQ